MRRVILLLASTLCLPACDDAPPTAPDYYDRVIQPILTASCVRNQGSCHKDDGTGAAFGNVDLTSYENTTRRKDVLRTYGSYPEPLLLLKGSGAGVVIPYKPGRGDGKPAFLASQIQHAGGAPIGRNSPAFFELQKWLANGATRDGAPAERPLDPANRGACTADFARARPDLAARFNTATVMDSDPSYQKYLTDVAPVLAKNCAFSSCHSSPQSDFFLSCGTKDGSVGDGDKFNYLEVRSFISAPPETSEFLLRPLSPSSGGVSHTGGVFFPSKSDATYGKLLAWAAMAGALDDPSTHTAGRQFFDHQVMPVLLERGCALEACHSPGAANDFKLRPGSQGYFSASALGRNYEEARRNFLVASIPDVRQSRLVRKPVLRISEGGVGIAHRGGPVLQSPSDAVDVDPSKCPPYDPATSSALCTVAEWHRLERQALTAKGEADPMNPGDSVPLVYVERPADTDRAIEFDRYRPGADLVVADVKLGALGHVDAISPRGSLLGDCPGTTATRDVRHPDIDYDRSQVVFAMRLSQADSLDLYLVQLDDSFAGHGCQKITDGNGQMKNGLPIHNLDPSFAPTTPSSILFVSTRGRPAVGPTLSQKYLRVQSDLWRISPDGKGGWSGAVQLTAQLGSELSPAMMQDGRISMSAEKASADFYQIAGRRINWDGTDYHPLLGQRSASRGFDPGTFATPGAVDTLPTHPSFGFQRATEIREGLDRNFVLVASDDSAPGAGGALVTFNRSVGPFEADRMNPGFLPSVEVIDGDGHKAGPGYRSPLQLPDGRYLASFSSDTAVGAYDLAIVDPAQPAGRRTLIAVNCSGRACVQAAIGYKRERGPLFANLPQLVFGGGVDGSDAAHGVVTYPDLPMLATLLSANLRTGRFVDSLRGARQVAIYEDTAATDMATGMAGQTGSQRVYQSRKLLGTAPLASDGAVKLRLPALTPLIVELQDDSGHPMLTMSEEDQLGAGEHISRGVPEPFFNSVCGGCHGSVSGRELDIAIDPDALTGASRSSAHDAAPTALGN